MANPLLAIGIAIPVAILIGATASAADPPVVPAGETVPASADIKVTVRPMQATTEQIVLSSGRSAVVDLSEPVKRVQVGAPEIAEVKILSPRQILVMGKGAGSTQLILWNEQDGQAVLKVLVQLDAADLQALIPQIAPGAEVQAKVYRDVLILTGTVPDVDSASRIEMIAREYSAKVQNHVKVAGMHQVLLRCTVAEVNKRAIRQLGLNGWLAGDNIRDVFMVSQIGGINPSNIGAGPVGNVIGRGGLPFTNFTGIPLNQSTQFSVGFPRVQMQLFFQALRQNDLLRVLAEPNLIALSGQEAAFLAGGEFPIPVPQGYNGTVTIEWRQYGVRLKFTPTAIGRQMIRLKVAPEVSEQDFTSAVQLAGYVVPALRSRSASTTVEIASGSTIAIAGLLSEQARASAAKVPGLGDVPVLGSLFSSVDYQKNLTELVILVTPELVDSMQPDQVPPVPGQNTLDPTDWELFGLGMVEGRPTPQSGDDAAALETGLAPKYRKFRSPPEQMSLHGPWGPADPAESIQ
ncbi:MAG TPA: type II and III secretion system protein family protein [Phycisphaerae bacterium]|nr:type II and III secretion system protein family protein [Phycisphaerae bacterium]